RSMEGALERTFPDLAEQLPSLLRFGSWIGGDRDGNPHVSGEVTRDAVRLHQETVLMHYLEQVLELGQRLSHSGPLLQPGQALLDSLAEDRRRMPTVPSRDDEPYRQKCRYIASRLKRTLEKAKASVSAWDDPRPQPEGEGYRSPA